MLAALGIPSRQHFTPAPPPAGDDWISCEMLMTQTGFKYTSAYSVVYEVHPPGGAPFRARGIEVMYFSEERANNLTPPSTVQVRFDPVDHTVTLVRVKAQDAQAQDEARRRAREEALLRGQPR